jgi:hypothetical protein
MKQAIVDKIKGRRILSQLAGGVATVTIVVAVAARAYAGVR